MKRFTAIAMLLLVALLMLSACTGSSTGSEKENNNEYQMANEITLDSSVKGKLLEFMDEDWFVFNVPATSQISIDLTLGRWATNDVEWYIDLFADDGFRSLETYKTVNRTEVTFDVGVLEKGTYYIRLRAGFGGNHMSYTLGLVKEHECNPVEHILSEPSCTEEGTVRLDCAICDVLLDYKEIPATGHAATDWTIDVEPTCKNKGSRHGKCINCDEEVTEILEITDHRFGDWEVVSGNVIIPPIVKEHKCIYCGCTETIKDWGYVWVSVLAGIAAIGVCFGIVAYIKAYKNP